MIEATYFDGQTSRRQPVTVVIHRCVLAMRGAGLHRSIRLSQLDISERLQYAPRILRFPDGSLIEVRDPGLDKLLAANRYSDPWVVRWQQNWPLSLCALVTLLALLISGYQWGLPWAVDKIAQGLPASVEEKIGDQQWKMIDGRYLTPSRLEPAEQARLRQLFSALQQPRGEKTSYRLEFRNSRIGPNAFALPNGVIVMTDQLVRLADNDQAVLGVLSHELGHLQRRHSFRHLMQALGLGAVLHLWVGDVSSALVAVPAFLLDKKYSRDFEREADQYAIDMMRANGMRLAPLADLFEKMGAARDNQQPGAADADGAEQSPGRTDDANARRGKTQRKASPEYLNSHPSNAERIARLRAADR